MMEGVVDFAVKLWSGAVMGAALFIGMAGVLLIALRLTEKAVLRTLDHYHMLAIIVKYARDVYWPERRRKREERKRAKEGG